MEIKYDFPSRSRKYDTDEYIYDADVSDYIQEISRKNPRKEIELAKKAWKEYEDTDQNISDLAEENEIKSEDDITYETSNGTYFIDHVFSVADDDTIEEMIGEDIKDYFEQDAREMFEDEELYHTDPYKYNGVDPKDFY